MRNHDQDVADKSQINAQEGRQAGLACGAQAPHSLRNRLNDERMRLRRRLADIEDALEAIETSPAGQRVADALSRLGHI